MSLVVQTRHGLEARHEDVRWILPPRRFKLMRKSARNRGTGHPLLRRTTKREFDPELAPKYRRGSTMRQAVTNLMSSRNVLARASKNELETRNKMETPLWKSFADGLASPLAAMNKMR